MSRAPPQRHWRSYGNDPLPSGIEARDEPFAAFPSWFLRIECDRCGKVQMINEVALRAAQHADSRHPREDAPRRLRRTGRQGGAAHRHRGRQQPAGATNRGAYRLIISPAPLPERAASTRHRCQATTESRDRTARRAA